MKAVESKSKTREALYKCQKLIIFITATTFLALKTPSFQ